MAEAGSRSGVKIFSLVPDFGEAALGTLAEIDWNEFRAQADCALRDAGVDRFFAGIDVSLNYFEAAETKRSFNSSYGG